MCLIYWHYLLILTKLNFFLSFLIVIEFLSPISSVYSNKLSLYYLNMCPFFTLIMNSE